MKAARHALILLLLLGVALLSGGWFHLRLADERRDAQLGELVARLRGLEVSLDREMVRLATLRLADYDGLVEIRKQLEKEVQALQRLKSRQPSQALSAARYFICSTSSSLRRRIVTSASRAALKA